MSITSEATFETAIIENLIASPKTTTQQQAYLRQK
jgi:hypothetical protein